MTKFIVSMDMIIEAENGADAAAKGEAIAAELRQENKLEYYLLADSARPVVVPES